VIDIGKTEIEDRGLFYRTINGAQVGDLFMTFIHTCELNGGQLVQLPDRVTTSR